MKRIGLIGGLSWYSSIEYYRILNSLTEECIGAHQQGNIVLVNVNLHEFNSLLKKDDTSRAIDLLISAAKTLESAGCDLILLCSNGAHRFFDQVKDSINTEMLHIADATAIAIQEQKIVKVGLLGAKSTMEEGFYQKRLSKFNIEIMIPVAEDSDLIDQIIFRELAQGSFIDTSRNSLIQIIKNMQKKGAKGVILGCTEIPLLINQNHLNLPVFSTTDLHCKSAFSKAISQT
jgi:aspartate racemase